jgi:archaeal chaperonin
MEPVDIMTDLRARQSKGSKWSGIDVRNARIADISKLETLEPLAVKEQIIKSATEAASMILRAQSTMLRKLYPIKHMIVNRIN